MSGETGGILNNVSDADATRARAANDAFEKVKVAVDIYIDQYLAGPYNSEKFMLLVGRILDAEVGKMMRSGDRQRLFGLAARAVAASKDKPKRNGRPPTPPEILDVALHLARIEHEEHKLPFTIEGAYRSACLRFVNDYGIVVQAETIKKIRERSLTNSQG